MTNFTNPEDPGFPRWANISAYDCGIEEAHIFIYEKMELGTVEHMSRANLLQGRFHPNTIAKAVNKYVNGRTALKPKEVAALIWCIILRRLLDTDYSHLLNKGFQVCDAHFKRVTSAKIDQRSLVKINISADILDDQLSAWRREVLGCDIEEWQLAARVEFGSPKVEQVGRQDSHRGKPTL